MIRRQTAKRALAGAVLALAALCLSGCAGFLQGLYDDAAHNDCGAQQACHDAVDENSRSHQY